MKHRVCLVVHSATASTTPPFNLQTYHRLIFEAPRTLDCSHYFLTSSRISGDVYRSSMVGSSLSSLNSCSLDSSYSFVRSTLVTQSSWNLATLSPHGSQEDTSWRAVVVWPIAAFTSARQCHSIEDGTGVTGASGFWRASGPVPA